MINKKKIFQAGSLMIEMVAVIGLIALMTPMLFHQIHRRNEEILNTQIATEIRAVKDAFAAYIAANADTLAVPPGTGIKNEGCSWREDLPIADFFTGDQSILGLYDYLVCVKWAPINTIDASNNSMPIVYGVVVQQKEDETNLRNAAKVASLIGLEGGVVMKNVINGIHDSWQVGFAAGDDKHISENDSAVRVAAITSFSELGGTSLLTDVKWNHLRAETAHADKIFSTSELGTPGVFVVDASTTCILNIGNNDQGIEKDSCTFFKVDATTKDVVISAPIRTGIAGPGTTCSGITTKDACEKEAHCIWLTKTNDAGEPSGGCYSEYALDPSNISLMKDIKLTSMGGAKLSDLLPKYSFQQRFLFHAGDEDDTWTTEISKCPSPLKTYISVLPLREKLNPAITNADITDVSEITDTTDIKASLRTLTQALTETEVRVMVESGSNETSSLGSLNGTVKEDEGRRQFEVSSEGDIIELTITPQVRVFNSEDLEGDWISDRNYTSVLLEVYCGK